MRTTLNLDDDVLRAAQERARRERRSVGAVVSELARAALTDPGRPPVEVAARRGFRPLPARGVIVTNDLVDELRADEP